MRYDGLVRRRARLALFATALWVGTLGASGASAAVPTAKELTERLGISDSDVQRALSGEFVSHSVEPSNPRELTTGLAFVVKGMTPTELVQLLRQGTSDQVDPNVLAWSFVKGDPKPGDFAKLALRPDPAKQAKAFARAEPGSDLNLSAEEIAAFHKLGSDSAAAVEGQLRGMLLARLQAYRGQGLAGIAPYARGGGKTRSPADDLRSASKAAKLLQEEAPATYRLLLEYPVGKPTGIEETFRWSQIEAHGEPTLVLTHAFAVPDGDAWIAVQRQFYVSTGYNCEQALAAFLPVKDGTAVFYSNRTSTDQVTGFGGSAKRSIGSRLLADQLKALFDKVRARPGGAGS